MKDSHEDLRVLFAGGGTGGHLFPAIAIADEIRRLCPGAAVRFAGARNRIEARVVPRHGYELSTIWISGFTRTLSLQNVLFPLKVCVSLMQSFALIRSFKPDVVVGTGGFVSGPVVSMASLLGLPTLIQEQNSVPGITTRLLAERATEVHLTYDVSRRYVARAKRIQVSGNPTRSRIGRTSRADGAAALGVDPARLTLLVLGGSQGASAINVAVTRALPQIVAMNVQVIWQTGEKDLGPCTQAAEQVAGKRSEKILVIPFIEQVECAYAATDLVVCRSGATTLAELTCSGLPSILVPYPFAAADHQTMNARAMVDAGASVMLPETDIDRLLADTMLSLLQDATRMREMGKRARALAKPDAAKELARAVIALGAR